MTQPTRVPLYHKILGDRFAELAKVLQVFHSREEGGRAAGELDVEGAANGFGAVVAWLGGLPRPEPGVPVRLVVTTNDRGECWERWFRDKRLVSWQWEWNGLLIESFGPLTIGFELVKEGRGIRFVPKRAWWLGVPILQPFAPKVDATIVPESDGWCVDVRVVMPFVGQLVRYHGMMKPQ